MVEKSTVDPACAAKEESAKSGEQPEEQPNRLPIGSKRPRVEPKRQRGRNGERERRRD